MNLFNLHMDSSVVLIVILILLVVKIGGLLGTTLVYIANVYSSSTIKKTLMVCSDTMSGMY